MNGYMDLFLETGNPAFYMMEKQAGETADIPVSRLGNLTAKEEASPR